MRIFFLLSFFLLSPLACIAQAPLYGLGVPDDMLKKIKPIFVQAKKGNWGKAKKMAEEKGPITRATLKWYYLMDEDTKPAFVEYETFLLAYPKWPDHLKLKRTAEITLLREVKEHTPQQILKWFARFSPVTKEGLMLQLNLTSDVKLKDKLIIKLWTSHDFSKKDESIFLKNYKKYIPKWAHGTRARRLMDKGKTKDLQRMMRFLNRDQKKLYQIRQQIARADRSIRHLRNSVPKSMLTDQGYLMQVLKWYHKRDHSDLAEAILLNHKPIKEYQTDWENIRRVQAREVMKTKQYRTAHDIAYRHSYKAGAQAADMEWFSGWVALEYLNNPQRALKHFNHVLRLVGTNLSLSRTYYWLGRTYVKLKDKKKANYYYKKALQFGWTFYGQLAASEMKVKPNMKAIKTQPIPGAKTALFQAAHILASIDEKKLARKLLQQGNARLSTAGQHLTLSYFAKKLGVAENVVRFARAAQNKAPGIAREAYPRLRKVFQNKEVKRGLDPALVHAVILQESRFDEDVVSFDFGYGYMQLMKPTAKRMSKLAKVRYNPKKLLNGDYNILLGTTYLRFLLDKFNGYFPFAAPSYNAGEDRVDRWHDEFGNPAKDGRINIVNWAESLTYVITRSYIQRILENVYVYRHVLKLNPAPIKPWWKNWNLSKKP